MRFTVSTSLLNKKLSSISKVINSKEACSLPLLSHFLFNIHEDNTMTVTASDVENVIITSVEIQDVEENGMFAVNASTLLNSLKEIPDQPITFDVNLTNGTLTVDYFSGVFKIPVSEGDTYPTPVSVDDTDSATISSSLLMDCINRSVGATAKDELRPVMNGIFFEVKDANTMYIVASDGHILVKNELTDINSSSENGFNFILPKKPAILLKTLLTSEDIDIEIASDGRNAKFTCEHFTMFCRLIEGRYPNFNSVIPQTHNFATTIDRKSILSSFRRVINFASVTSQLVSIEISSDKVQLKAEDVDFSISAKEDIQATTEGEGTLVVGCNASKVIGFLSLLDCENVCFKFIDSMKPVLVIPENQRDDCTVTNLFMPMLINN